MDKHEETRDLVARLLERQRFAVLSTQSETGPYCSLISFWAAADLSHVVFPTMRATHKFNYLLTHPRVALLFDDRSNQESDIHEASAVTATGTARELVDQETRTAASTALLERHPLLAGFVTSPECTFIRVDVDVFHVATQLQNVVELHLADLDSQG